MYMAVFQFEVPEENQEAYFKATTEIIKPFWEAHECISYEVYQDYFVGPTHFVKIQYYPDKETMERSLLLARQDDEGKAAVAEFMKHIKPDTLQQRRVVPVIDKNGLVK